MSPTVVCIVEGHAEVDSLPILMRRLFADLGHPEIQVPPPIRCPKNKIVRGDDIINRAELERAIRLATFKLPSAASGAILVILDSDDGCPARLGPRILSLSREIRGDVCARVVIPKREYEAWLVAAVESLRGHRRIREDAERHPSPEGLADPKGYLTNQMHPGARYSETLDQPAFTALFDFALAETTESFRKMRREVLVICQHLFPEGLEQG
jgi:hypothetical protein